MRTGKTYFRFIIMPLILCFVMSSFVFPQGTETRRKAVKQNKFYIGFNLDPVQASIYNEDFKSASPLTCEKGNSINMALDFGYLFSGIAGISIGAGFNSCSSKQSVFSTSITFQDTDSENEDYEMRIKGDSITEDQTISMIEFPVCLNLKIKAGQKSGFYVKAGAAINIPMEKSYTGKGTFSYSGYYPEYPVLLQDLPDYGFPTGQNTSSSGDLELEPFFTTVLVSGGFTYSISEKITLMLGAAFSKSLGNISAYVPDPDYRLTSKANELNSIMAGSSGAGLQSAGLSIGLRYYLK